MQLTGYSGYITMIYLDHAATSYPKAEACLRNALEAYLALGASPGRGGYDRAVEAERKVTRVRDKVAHFFGAPDYRVCFAGNATDALNTLIQGLATPGAHFISTCLEHNSVLRPLHHLRSRGRIEFDLARFDEHGFMHPENIATLFRPTTRAVILNHASNVLGTVQPVAEIGALCRQRGIPLLLDASQSAGQIPINLPAMHVAALAFTGHKSLQGPTGIGGLVLHPELDLTPSRYGGTGVDSENLFQTPEYPYRLESGTLNVFGILALGEVLELHTAETMHTRLAGEMKLFQMLREGLLDTHGVRVFGGNDLNRQLPVLACTVNGHKAVDAGAILDGDFDIAIRAGLHCAPLVHKILGTAPHGAIRFSLGPETTLEDIEITLEAMRQIASK